MDRNAIAPWKAEEREQSEKLYKKLQGLALLYPMNEEMSKLLSWDMFLKSNQLAFFQVMSYLFRILDPAEFKRRFFWPITDKKSEANFRSTTVDYLKHLNDKHQLQWTNIKSYLVVMPGGMKFINFLLDLVGFVIHELTKQREKVLAADMDISNFRDFSVHSMSRQNAFMKEYASCYIEELEKATARLRERINKIVQIFAEIANKSGVDESILQDDQFLENFEAHNIRKYEKQIVQPAANIAKLESPLCALAQAMDEYQSKRAEHRHNKDAVDKALLGIRKLLGFDNVNAPGGNCSRINEMLSAFNDISATIAEQLDANNHYNESNEFVTTDLEALRVELQQIELQMTEVQRNINARAKEHNSNISGKTVISMPTHTPLRSLDPRMKSGDAVHQIKFVSTPPIKPEMINGVRSVHVRIPLQDDFNAKQFETTCISLLAPAVPRSARRVNPHQSLCDLNSTLARSKIVDPMQMLRTINKKPVTSRSNTHSNLSSLGSKWKQLQASFGFDDAAPAAVPASPKTNPIPISSPITPFNHHERTRIERLSVDMNKSSLYAKSAAVKKVLDASLNVKNLSTSPSGRLDPLVPDPLVETQNIPLILVNDQTINVLLLGDNNNKENDAHTLNKFPPKFCLDLDDYGDKDELENISDSVLNDISI